MDKNFKPIIIKQIFDRTVEDVWSAITNPCEMTQWFFSNIPSFEAVVGFKTQFIIQVEDRVFPHLWKVTEVIPKKKISYEWQYEGYPGKAISEFEIFQKNNQTRLKLTYRVIESFPGDVPEFKRESGVEGWNYFIKKNLKDYLDYLA